MAKKTRRIFAEVSFVSNRTIRYRMESNRIYKDGKIAVNCRKFFDIIAECRSQDMTEAGKRQRMEKGKKWLPG